MANPTIYRVYPEPRIGAGTMIQKSPRTIFSRSLHKVCHESVYEYELGCVHV